MYEFLWAQNLTFIGTGSTEPSNTDVIVYLVFIDVLGEVYAKTSVLYVKLENVSTRLVQRAYMLTPMIGVKLLPSP